MYKLKIRSYILTLIYTIMMKKNFSWKSVLYLSIALCMSAGLIFFCGFFTANMDSLREYHPLVLNAFAWTGLAGSILFYVWALPYIVRFIGEVIKYYRYRICW